MVSVASVVNRIIAVMGLVTIAVPLAVPPAQADTALTERIPYINSCRLINRTTEVFNNSGLSPASTRVGTLTANTNVTLTGVLTTGRAQIFVPNSDRSIRVMGWVDAANLGACGNTSTGNPTSPTVPPTGTAACFRVNSSMAVRSNASSTSSILGAFQAGDIARATTTPPTERVSPNSAPDYGRVWTQVSIFSNGVGWVSRTGTYGTGSNLTPLPAAQCQ